jgi:hypothetical protein
MGKMRNAYKILAGKPEGKSPFKNAGCKGVDQIYLAQDRDQ